MSEFVFRNLSVKLFPAEGQGRPFGGGCEDSRVMDCDACSTECTNMFTCGPCTDTPTCGDHPPTAECVDDITDQACAPGTIPCDPFTNIVPLKADEVDGIRGRLVARKEQVRQYLGEIEAGERYLAAGGKPGTVEEIDQLRQQLLAAVAELDEQRAQLEGGEPT